MSATILTYKPPSPKLRFSDLIVGKLYIWHALGGQYVVVLCGNALNEDEKFLVVVHYLETEYYLGQKLSPPNKDRAVWEELPTTSTIHICNGTEEDLNFEKG